MTVGAVEPWAMRGDTDRTADVGLVRPGMVAGGVVTVVLMLWHAPFLQALEAAVTAWCARLIGVSDAYQIGRSVLFTVDGQATGIDITVGCTAAFLLLPFVAATTVLLAVRRIPAVRAFASLITAVVLILAVNQARMLAITAGMAHWGPEVGYARTHVLVGTAVSTVGLVLAGTCYLLVLLRGTYQSPALDPWDVEEAHR
ncbi:archaeosortase/exosortase family protein [Klenkia sp. PcliD-1-E]|uniref:archaeosortase/exosortase family protein n=1 Tax=Klenkia sp. PcliD-1-E TaxID=2954492 RepID=UPI00209852F6|nr:archaeosortase/exosortase family protein [Klenkia sp. PcliD-1-E]MCO7221915.1 archaeosortase/exosortase family protein [Klenkia sp. PcliD-1-E]